MDTLDYYAGNTRQNNSLAVNIALLGTFVLLQPLFFYPPILANDMTLAKISNPVLNVPVKNTVVEIEKEISPEIRAANFNNRVKEKYPKAVIKDVAKGVKHIRLVRYYDGKPVRINVVEIERKLADDFEIKPALSSTSNNLNSKRTITTIAKNTNSIAAINGTYFKPQTGVPLGTLMIDRKIYTGPVYDRVAMGIFDDGFKTARLQMNGEIRANGKTLKVDNINQPRMLSTHTIIYTPEWGKSSPATPKYGYQLAIKDNKIISASYNPLAIPDGGYVISAPLSVLKPFLNAKKIKITLNTSPEWKNVRHIISGGPYLVKNSEVFVDMTAQKLGAIGGKNPRTAIGYTADDIFIMVAVDGREGSSVGMTLMQLANFMKSLGCTDAINLDGGGSTVMYVGGQVVNKPAFKGGIAISNALVLSSKSKL